MIASNLLARAKKEAALARERIISLRESGLPFESQSLFWISGLFFVLFQGTITAMLWRVDDPWAILTHQLSSNRDSFLVQRDNWGAEKVALYLQHYWLDFIHPAIYAVFFRCLLTQIYVSFPNQFIYHCLAFPIAAAIYDEIENICQLPLMAGWMENNFVFYAGALSSLMKWMLLLAAFSAGIYSLAKESWSRLIGG